MVGTVCILYSKHLAVGAGEPVNVDALARSSARDTLQVPVHIFDLSAFPDLFAGSGNFAGFVSFPYLFKGKNKFFWLRVALVLIFFMRNNGCIDYL
jgi:hypothetical protein